MSRKKLLRKMCRCKRRFETRATAIEAMYRTYSPRGGLSVYYCDICQHWHIGHTRKNRRRDPPNGGKIWSVLSKFF